MTLPARNFYPRSPCGERLGGGVFFGTPGHISIHALLAESDKHQHHNFGRIPNFYPRSPCGERLMWYQCNTVVKEFLSTLSLRRATLNQILPRGFHYHFYPRSPCGERLRWTTWNRPTHVFLSTLSLRRATCGCFARCRFWAYFYPRSPCGERPK